MGERLMGAKRWSVTGWSVPVFVFAFVSSMVCTAAAPLRAQNQNPTGRRMSLPLRANRTAPPQQSDDATPSQAPQQPLSQDNPAPAQTQGAPAPQAAVPVPPTLTLPAGAVISVRSTQWLSSDKNHPGDTFSATLDQPVVANGWVVARRGQNHTGPRRRGPKSQPGKWRFPIGRGDYGVDARRWRAGSREHAHAAGRAPALFADPGRSAATVATTTAVGAIVGAAVGRGVGAAIGAGLGATTGAAIVLSSRGRATMIAPEALLTFQHLAGLRLHRQGPGRISPRVAKRLQRSGRLRQWPRPPPRLWTRLSDRSLLLRRLLRRISLSLLRLVLLSRSVRRRRLRLGIGRILWRLRPIRGLRPIRRLPPLEFFRPHC